MKLYNSAYSVRIFLDSYGDTPVCEAAGTESLLTPRSHQLHLTYSRTTLLRAQWLPHWAVRMQKVLLDSTALGPTSTLSPTLTLPIPIFREFPPSIVMVAIEAACNSEYPSHFFLKSNNGILSFQLIYNVALMSAV